MPRLSQDRVPPYRFHKQLGQSVVNLDCRDYLTGKFGSAEAIASTSGSPLSVRQWPPTPIAGQASMRLALAAEPAGCAPKR